MEYPNITAAVPNGEHFDASAVNEGVWMSEAHLGSIEARMADNATALADQALQAQQAVAAQQAAETALATANSTITERDATIAAQAQEIATLKAGPAASMKNTSKEKDDLGNTAVVEESEITKEARRLREMRDGK